MYKKRRLSKNRKFLDSPYLGFWAMCYLVKK